MKKAAVVLAALALFLLIIALAPLIPATASSNQFVVRSQSCGFFTLLPSGNVVADAQGKVSFVLRKTNVKNLYFITRAVYTVKAQSSFGNKSNVSIDSTNTGSRNGPWRTIWQSGDDVPRSTTQSVPISRYIAGGSRLSAQFTFDKSRGGDPQCRATPKRLPVNYFGQR